MSRTLTLSEVHAIRSMLRTGMRHVDIARALDLSIWTVARIDADRRSHRDELVEEEPLVDDAPPDYVSHNLRRCPGCGAMVYRWPCLACCMANSPRLPLAEEVDDDAEDVDALFDLFEDVARS
jgi:hypothetical protein